MFNNVDGRPDFPELERKHLARWYESGLVDKYLHKNDASSEHFSFLDGPITANNPMGVHHAWGRSYKDLWQRFHNLLGHKQRFQNGFDCQGLWVEVEVEKELEIRNKKDIENLVEGDRIASIAKFVQLCKDRVIKYSGIQTEQTKRLGNFMDWEHSYFTMSDENNYMIWHFLKVVHEHGWLYKGHDAVPWCPRCETAISQHEILTEDYKELTHESIYVKLPVKGKNRTNLLIWTTTPWTMPANVAVGVNKDLTYAEWQNEAGEKIIFLDTNEEGETPQRMLKKRSVSIHEYVLHNVEGGWEKTGVYKGSDIIGWEYDAPFDDLPVVQDARESTPHGFHTVVDASDLVNAEEGTGLLHIATGAGTEDFRLGKKIGLAVISVIADDASYLDGLGEFSGKNAKAHPELIIDSLREKGALLKSEHYTHRYPACWRCKKELVWKVADEWYISMDTPSQKDGKTFREKMIANAQKITWHPSFGLERELDWLNHMEDWLISKKNRYWGLALPIYECECGHIHVLDGKNDLKEKAVEGWSDFEGKSPHKPYIDLVKISCEKCGKPVARVDDVGNPWLDAGIVPYSTITENNQGEPLYSKNNAEWRTWFPVDFITESFPGQFKNWFYAMIAMSTALEDEAPFKAVLGFATLHAEDGRPMHKSWGNSIEFNEAADTIGADVMRWMYARTNPSENMLFGYKIGDEVRRSFILILWNIYKFFVEYAQLDGYEEAVLQPTSALDMWILARLHETVEKVKTHLLAYDARSATSSIESLVQDISTWYIRRSRGRVWTNSEDSTDKEQFYATLQYVLTNVCIVISPITPFISEEIYTHLTKEESVHLATWPELHHKNDELLKQMDELRKIIEVGHRERKVAKVKVRQPLAKVTFKVTTDVVFTDDLTLMAAEELNVHEVVFEKGDELSAEYDLNITHDLQDEGDARELIREIQQKRQELGLTQSDTISLTVPSIPGGYKEYIKQRVLAKEINTGPELIITKLS